MNYQSKEIIEVHSATTAEGNIRQIFIYEYPDCFYVYTTYNETLEQTEKFDFKDGISSALSMARAEFNRRIEESK